ncbi:MAG TPA: S49 family peptidase [Burkholderiales bacterium]|jgi:protease-4|nr:S49 family peptidase [Burkholderiales bacterium]
MGWFTFRGSKRSDGEPAQPSDGGDGRWERDLIARLANAALVEQRRARRWGIFFKLLFFVYLTFLLAALVDWEGAGVGGGKKHTAMVDLEGIIAPGNDASAEKINASLQAAFKDKNTQGVILRINSPGGSPVQAQTIYDEMRRLRRKYPEIPLYAVVEDICASGGYFVAAGADKIYVTKSSIVGSIGVLMNGFGFTGLMDKLGIDRRLITAGENKGMLDPFSPLSEKDKAYAQKLIDDVHQQFIAVVREGRGKRLKETPDMFSGLFWTGDKSVELGLADGYGTLESVARDVIKAEDIVDYTQKEGIAERVAKRFGAAMASTLAETALRGSSLLR